MKNFVFKFVGTLGYIVQCGCVAHCVFEYLGDFVLVCYNLYTANKYDLHFHYEIYKYIQSL